MRCWDARFQDASVANSDTNACRLLRQGRAGQDPPLQGAKLLLLGGGLAEGEEHRLGGRSIGNLLELRKLAAERLWDLHLRALQDADELQGVDHRFALKMIVGDDKCFVGSLRDFADACNPGR